MGISVNFAEIISGDGTNVFREKIILDSTTSFGKEKFTFSTNLKHRKWVRIKAWDITANGAFTQQVWIK